MDFQIFPQGYVEQRFSGKSFGPTKTISGFGDTTLRLKVNFLGNDGGDFVLGMVPRSKSPPTQPTLATSCSTSGFGLPINYNLPAGFVLFAQTRIDLPED